MSDTRPPRARSAIPLATHINQTELPLERSEAHARPDEGTVITDHDAESRIVG